MKSRFDAFEIHPVKKVDGGDSPYDCFEKCEEDDPEIHAWAVYGHVSDKGLECLADCPSKETAELVKSALEIACLKHGTLVAAAKTVLSRWERGDLADAVRKLDSVLRCDGLSGDPLLLNNGGTTSGGRKCIKYLSLLLPRCSIPRYRKPRGNSEGKGISNLRNL